MATLREFYDLDFNRCLTVHADWQIQSNESTHQSAIRARISQDLEANAKYWSFYIPPFVDILSYVFAILNAPETGLCVLNGTNDSVAVEMRIDGCESVATTESLVFTKRIFFYIDDDLSQDVFKNVIALGKQKGFDIQIRDQKYALSRSKMQKPEAFISHDSRDKDELVRQLALEMSQLLCSVWYDEYSLEVGDSLRTSIEAGLRETTNCIVILSPNFFSNKGWGQAEFDSIYSREIIEKKNVILPVWHNVTPEDVYQYCPRLVDRVGLNSSLGPERLAKKLVNKIRSIKPSER